MYLGIVSGSCSSGVLSMLGSELVGSSLCLCYILLYIHILIYIILYYTLLIHLLFFYSSSSSHSLLLIHSILVGTYIRSFIYFRSPLFGILTPHVLSEWMVEV